MTHLDRRAVGEAGEVGQAAPGTEQRRIAGELQSHVKLLAHEGGEVVVDHILVTHDLGDGNSRLHSIREVFAANVHPSRRVKRVGHVARSEHVRIA